MPYGWQTEYLIYRMVVVVRTVLAVLPALCCTDCTPHFPDVDCCKDCTDMLPCFCCTNRTPDLLVSGCC